MPAPNPLLFFVGLAGSTSEMPVIACVRGKQTEHSTIFFSSEWVGSLFFERSDWIVFFIKSDYGLGFYSKKCL
jgi:hypothetical protein